jgi:uncharacterized Zn finger protein (UPF0148 family)
VDNPGEVVEQVVDRVKQLGKVCFNCGAPLKSGAVFCGKCGTRLGEAAAEKAKEQIEDAVVEKVEGALDAEKEERPSGKAAKKKPQQEKLSEKQVEQRNTTTRTQCPQCGRRVQKTWKFCPDCSAALERVCAQCGASVKPEWRFCPHCTASLTE